MSRLLFFPGVFLKGKMKGSGKRELTVCPGQYSMLLDIRLFGLSYKESVDPEAISGLPLPGNKDFRTTRQF